MSENSDKFDPLFVNLVLTLHGAAMQHMGKVKNPLTDQVERDMAQAEMSIDMLDMLRKKSDGNLTDEENNILSRTLNELKMNFMDEKTKDEKTELEEEKKDDGSENEPDKAETESGDSGGVEKDKENNKKG